jgi:hypothetical protein
MAEMLSWNIILSRIWASAPDLLINELNESDLLQGLTSESNITLAYGVVSVAKWIALSLDSNYISFADFKDQLFDQVQGKNWIQEGDIAVFAINLFDDELYWISTEPKFEILKAQN